MDILFRRNLENGNCGEHPEEENELKMIEFGESIV